MTSATTRDDGCSRALLNQPLASYRIGSVLRQWWMRNWFFSFITSTKGALPVRDKGKKEGIEGEKEGEGERKRGETAWDGDGG